MHHCDLFKGPHSFVGMQTQQVRRPVKPIYASRTVRAKAVPKGFVRAKSVSNWQSSSLLRKQQSFLEDPEQTCKQLGKVYQEVQDCFTVDPNGYDVFAENDVRGENSRTLLHDYHTVNNIKLAGSLGVTCAAMTLNPLFVVFGFLAVFRHYKVARHNPIYDAKCPDTCYPETISSQRWLKVVPPRLKAFHHH